MVFLRRQSFQSALPVKGMTTKCGMIYESCEFQSTSLRVGDDCARLLPCNPGTNFNPRPLTRGDISTDDLKDLQAISIHVPCVGDDGHIRRYAAYLRISIHVPREEGDDPRPSG